MKIKILIISLLFFQYSFSQYYGAKEYSKEDALFEAKEFLMNEVMGTNENDVGFNIIPLAAAKSGELTTLIYSCESKDLEGIILGFYGRYWNKEGVTYTGYGFKNLDRDHAIKFLNKITSSLENNSKFLKKDPDNNIIIFQYEDIKVMLSKNLTSNKIRLFWKDYDSTWEETAYGRTVNRFARKLK